MSGTLHHCRRISSNFHWSVGCGDYPGVRVHLRRVRGCQAGLMDALPVLLEPKPPTREVLHAVSSPRPPPAAVVVRPDRTVVAAERIRVNLSVSAGGWRSRPTARRSHGAEQSDLVTGERRAHERSSLQALSGFISVSSPPRSAPAGMTRSRQNRSPLRRPELSPQFLVPPHITPTVCTQGSTYVFEDSYSHTEETFDTREKINSEKFSCVFTAERNQGQKPVKQARITSATDDELKDGGVRKLSERIIMGE
ncbi:unnamed protein product [Pleuronectes platessa]|uniref:Uncharacterized protein n=1 Tax=Pleuronectes platessa TaxID=8262 RepID=A0A9N7Y8Q6_PLEPL|nr:unnamed protein product [Pleuronectes platessa]